MSRQVKHGLNILVLTKRSKVLLKIGMSFVNAMLRFSIEFLVSTEKKMCILAM